MHNNNINNNSNDSDDDNNDDTYELFTKTFNNLLIYLFSLTI